MSSPAKNDRDKNQYQDLSSPPKRSRACLLFVCISPFLILALVVSLWNYFDPLKNYNPYQPMDLYGSSFMNLQLMDLQLMDYHFNGSLLYTTSDKFLSFSLDTSLLRKMNELPVGEKKFINLARHLSPAYLRIGGTSADCLIFHKNQKHQIPSKKIPSPMDSQDISNFTISGEDLLAVYDFTVKSNLRMIFDLNALLRNPDGSWYETNAQEIIAFAKNQDMQLDWQLGNEPNSFKRVFNVSISAVELAKDYDHLRQLLDEAGYADSILIGPEVNDVGFEEEIGEKYITLFLKSQRSIVDYVTWHQYYLNWRTTKVDDLVDLFVFIRLPLQIQFMKAATAASGTNIPIWLSQTGIAWGGAPGLSDRFVAGFLWLDKLGYSASTGLNVVIRQSLFGGDYAMVSPDLRPNPDWWISVFYKQFVSEKVLKLSTFNNHGYVRLYAHCTPKKALTAKVPAVTIYGINIHTNEVCINIPQFANTDKIVKRHLYLLTADYLESREIKMNGEVLELQSNGDLPPFRPTVLERTDPVILPPYSMVFMIIHGIEVPVCSA